MLAPVALPINRGLFGPSGYFHSLSLIQFASLFRVFVLYINLIFSYIPIFACLISQMDREWMYQKHVTNVYLDGVSEFLKAAQDNVVRTKDPWVPCPCSDCENCKSFTNITQIQTHLIKRGFMAGYECWSQHEIGRAHV